jgi:beta-lactamase regulating signal transducer with metallopeptidase domain
MAHEALSHLVAVTLVSSLGMIAVLALRRVIRRIVGASASYSLWLIVPITMLSVVLPHLHAAGSTTSLSPLPETTSPLTYMVHRSLGSLAPATSSAVDVSLFALGVWGAGAVIFALYLVGLQRIFVNSLGTLSGSHCVLRAEHSVGCPALIGVLRPRVVLPADFRSRYTRLERLLIICHERTHLRRGDARWNALVALLRCIFWFNPVVHVAARLFRFDQELACDAAVVHGRRGSCRPYACAMLKTQLTEGELPVGCHWRSVEDLKGRLRMLNRPAPNRRRRWFGGATTTLTAVLVAYSAWAADPVGSGTATPALSRLTAARPLLSWSAKWSGWLTLPNQAPDQPVIIAVRDAVLILPAGMIMMATGAMVRSGQTTTLQGHVHLTQISPGAEPGRPQTTTVDANRAVLVERPDGTIQLQVGEATVQTAIPPQSVGSSLIPPQLLAPAVDRLTPNFKDADLSQVAAAVQLATHLTIIVDPRVRARLTMRSTMPMTPEAFYQAFQEILGTRGFVAMPVGPTGNVIRLLPGATAD